MKIRRRECQRLMESELGPRKPSSYELLALNGASIFGHLRFFIIDKLPDVPEDDTGMKVAFNVGLLKGDNFCTKQMFYLKIDSVILLET